MVLRNTRIAIAILAQGNSLELERAASDYCAWANSSYMLTLEVDSRRSYLTSRVAFEDLDYQ